MECTTRAELLGLPFDAITLEAAVERCLSWCAGPRSPHTDITANAALLCMMRHDPELKRACLAGDLILPDGMSVVWASRMAGVRFPERVAGVDLMARLLEAGARRGLRVYFLGAKPAVVSRLAESCARDHPGLEVVGYRDGYFSADQHAAVVEEIRGRAPHFLFVGMPSPFKETWCEQLHVQHPVQRQPARRTADHGSRRQLRRARRLCAARAAVDASGRDGVVLAPADGAAEDVAKVLDHQCRVRLPGDSRDPLAEMAAGGTPRHEAGGSASVKRKSILIFMGTRPEAIKLAPVVAALRGASEFKCTVVATGQHREMFRQVAEQLGISANAVFKAKRRVLSRIREAYEYLQANW